MALSLSSAFLTNVKAQFDSLNSVGERLAVEVPPKDEFADHRYSVRHKHGGQDNHIQGVQRIGDSNHLLISGSYPYDNSRADLFVVRFASKAADPGPWGSNLVHSRDPKSADTLVNYFKMDAEYWHPGGLSLLGSVLAVPFENDPGQSKIAFYDMSAPEQPKALSTPKPIMRKIHKAGACALTRLPNDYFLLAVWTDSDKKELVGENPRFHLDFYLSKEKDFKKGFPQKPTNILYPNKNNPLHKNHQGINFLWQLKENKTDPQKNIYTLYLVTFENTAKVQPLPPPFEGKNKAYLFEVKLPPAWLRDPPEPMDTAPKVKFVAEKKFEYHGDWYNMDGSGGLYVDSNQNLIVYSTYHFRTPLRKSVFKKQKYVIKSLEFRATDFSETINSIKDGWVELYKDLGFEGPRLAITGPWEATVADYSKIRVNDKKFKKVKSVKFQIPDKLAYVLYRKKHFGGERPLVLLGDGKQKKLNNLKDFGFDSDIKSSQFLKAEVAKALPKPIILT